MEIKYMVFNKMFGTIVLFITKQFYSYFSNKTKFLYTARTFSSINFLSKLNMISVIYKWKHPNGFNNDLSRSWRLQMGPLGWITLFFVVPHLSFVKYLSSSYRQSIFAGMIQHGSQSAVYFLNLPVLILWGSMMFMTLVAGEKYAVKKSTNLRIRRLGFVSQAGHFISVDLISHCWMRR